MRRSIFQKGNSPDRYLRSLIVKLSVLNCSSGKDNQKVRLEAAIQPFYENESVTAH